MTTEYPIEIPSELRSTLPSPSRDGNVYTDVKFRGNWDGILVVNSDYQIIGVYIGRQISEWPLPFTVEEIESFRQPTLWHRFLASLPSWFDVPSIALASVWIGCPVILICGHLISSWFLLVPVPVVLLAIGVLYSSRGFLYVRLPTVLAGIAFALAGVSGYLGKS